MSKINILGNDLEILDSLENITVADSFVKINKIGEGHGEARLYVGPNSGGVIEFFENCNTHKAFFLKKDFKLYLEDAEFEYYNKEQPYIRNITENYNGNVKEINNLNDIINFKIVPANGAEDLYRYYIRSDDSIYEFMRKVALPQISYITILKLKYNNKIFYYFRLFLEYYTSTNHPKLIEQEVQEIEKSKENRRTKDQLIKARIGQGAFREKLLEEIQYCLITKVTDERILIASHIKPWVKSDDNEKINPKNGLVFTPTYDQLFGKGFITFDINRKLYISPYISPMNIKRLCLKNNTYTEFPLKGREIFLEYHNKYIFKQ
ncbi:hypothetical protein ES705_25989 [subsurface metagenome]